MPIKWLVEYYDQMAKNILPFLRGRKVGLRQMFDHQLVFRRHEPKTEQFLRIKSATEIIEWARQHTYGFFPHLLGDRDLWFALDMDQHKTSFDCIKIAAAEMAEMLAENQVKFVVKFSGANGFHFLWRFSEPRIANPWDFEQKIVEWLQQKLEERLQRHPKRDLFYQYLRKTDPMTLDNAMNRENVRSILIDKYILKKNGSIRAPYSLHEKSRLASIFIEPTKILAFYKDLAEPQKVMNEKWKIKSLPKNSAGKLKKLIAE